jgi:hypothetical protein
MNAIIENIKKELNVNIVSSRVLDELSKQSGLVCEFVKQGTSHSLIWGVRRPKSKAYRMVGSAKEVAEFMASEIEA